MTRYLLNSIIITRADGRACPRAVDARGLRPVALPLSGRDLDLRAVYRGQLPAAQIMMIPVRDLMVRLGLYDTHLALIVFHTAFQTGFATLFMRNFIAALPSELFQAARAEGASPGQILWHVVLPLMRPALAALAILMVHLCLERLFLVGGPDPVRCGQARDSRAE